MAASAIKLCCSQESSAQLCPLRSPKASKANPSESNARTSSSSIHGRHPAFAHPRLLRHRRRRAVSGFGVRPLRAPVQGGLPRLLPRARQRRLLRVRLPGGDLQRRAPRRGGPRAVQGRRGLRRVLPGPLHGRLPLHPLGRHGGRHGQGARRHHEPHRRRRPRAGRRGVRGHGPRRRRLCRGAAAQGAGRRGRGVQEGAVRVRAPPQPLGARRGTGHGRPGAAVPVPGRADGHRGGGRGRGRVVRRGLEGHGAGAGRAGVERDGPGAGAGGPAAAPDGGHRRVRREVGVGRRGGRPKAVGRRPGVRHGRADRRRGAGRVLPMRRSRVEVTRTD